MILTESVKYAGSKAKIIKYLIPEISNLNQVSILDGFAGSTRVSQALSQINMNVTLNDHSILSKTFGSCYLLSDNSNKLYENQISYLNSLSGSYGWFSKNYGGEFNLGNARDINGMSKPWQLHNTLKLDSIRIEIDKIAEDELNKCVLLTSLIMALDSVDNTLGHYAGYLSKWSTRSSNTMILRKPNVPIRSSNQIHQVYSNDIFDILNEYEFDICYFDPPYGSGNKKMPSSRIRYDAYYHIWKSIILNDKPKLFGKVGRREDSKDKVSYSKFEDFRKNSNGTFKSIEAISDMINKAKCKYVVLSYSNGGCATLETLLDILNSNGHIEKIIKINHAKNIMASMIYTGKWVNEFEDEHQEYIFILKK